MAEETRRSTTTNVISMGRTCIANLKDVEKCDMTLEDIDKIKEIITDEGAHIISTNYHFFTPYGLSVTYILSESHLAIHTWPEHKCLAIDAFTCGDVVDPHTLVEKISKYLNATIEKIFDFERGIS
jgi:S-adenosylmethionine decarboxylase